MGKIKYPNGKPCKCGCGQTAGKNIGPGGRNLGWLKFAPGHVPSPAMCRSEVREKARLNKASRFPAGSRRLHRVGNKTYWVIKVAGLRRWRLEHRYIMEQRLGRSLSPDEHVHHRDGNGMNNGLHEDGNDNLQLMSNSEHLRLEGALSAKKIPKCVCPDCGQTHWRKGSRVD